MKGKRFSEEQIIAVLKGSEAGPKTKVLCRRHGISEPTFYKRIGGVERKPLPKPTRANLSWSMDFVADGLIGGRRLRCLTIVDDCTRECLVIEVDTSITC
jgi:transposase InsO family protein